MQRSAWKVLFSELPLQDPAYVEAREPFGVRCSPPTSKHQIPYVAVPHKNAESCKTSTEVSYQREPDYERVPAELIPPTYVGFVTGFAA